MKRESITTSGGASGPAPGSTFWVTCSRCRALHRPEDETAFDPICEPCRRKVGIGARAMPSFHPLSDRAIADAVSETSAGSYALGYCEGSDFQPFYVGRSDSDLGARLHDWVGAPSRPRRYASSPHTPWGSRSGPLPALGTRALGRIPIGIDTPYTHFVFSYAPSAREAFEQECRDYHELGGSEGLDNRSHPEPPPGSLRSCPVHGSFA